MILQSNDTPVFSSGNIVQKEFTITASSKAFKILSSNLYKNKIRAFIRELSANAYDAHIAAGCPEKQFDVHIPSAIDPMFWIRDYGIGLSKDSVMSLYTTYFESTKAESNDFVGALGLGSKSPFSYVDSFSVTSYFDGTITMYDMSLKSGVPNVAVLFEGETTEPNGLKVAMSINNDDIERVREESSYVYGTFKVKPNFIGREVECEMKEVQQGDGYFTCQDKHQYYGLFALMGNIAYPISVRDIAVGNVLRSIIDSRPVFIEFKLGELDITPSREELSYDPQTIDVLTKRVEEIEGVVMTDVLEKYKDIVCPREAYAMSDREPSGIRSMIRNEVMIEGKSLRAWESWCHWDCIADGFGRTKYRKVSVNADGVKATWKGSRGWDSVDLGRIGRTDPPIIMNNDTGGDYLNTIRALVANGTLKEGDVVYMFKSTERPQELIMESLIEKWRGKATVFVNSELKAIRSAYVKANKDTSVHKVSRGLKIRGEEFCLIKSTGNFYCQSKQIYAADIDEYEGLYVLKFFDDLVDHDGKLVITSSIIKTLMLVHDVSTVMVVRKEYWERIKKNPKAVHVAEKMYTTIRESSPKQVAIKFDTIVSSATPAWIKNTVSANKKFQSRLIGKKKYKKAHKLHSFFYELRSFSNKTHWPEDVQKSVDVFTGKVKAIAMSAGKGYDNLHSKYPMLAKVMASAYSAVDQRAYAPEIEKILN